jgi:hypothetical protein
MDALFGILFHPCRILCQFAERSLQFSAFTYFIRVMGGSCAIVILCCFSAVILWAEHAHDGGLLVAPGRLRPCALTVLAECLGGAG